MARYLWVANDAQGADISASNPKNWVNADNGKAPTTNPFLPAVVPNPVPNQPAIPQDSLIFDHGVVYTAINDTGSAANCDLNFHEDASVISLTIKQYDGTVKLASD